MNLKEKVISLVGALFIAFLFIKVLVPFIGPKSYAIFGLYGSKVLFFILALVVITGVILLADSLLNRPKKLKTLDGKSLFESKTFWSAFIMFILSTVSEFTGPPFINPEEVHDLILGLDWKNVTTSVVSVFVMFVRYFDVQKVITGIVPNDKEN